MNINFHVEQGKKTLNIPLEENETFHEVLIKLATIIQVEVSNLKLLYRSRSIQSNQLVGDLHLRDGDTINVLLFNCKKTTTPKEETPRKEKEIPPKEKPAPKKDGSLFNSDGQITRQCLPQRNYKKSNSQDPPHFETMVKALIEMGFDREKSIQALRASFYNPDRAAEYLIENNIPAELCNDDRLLLEQRDKFYLTDSKTEQKNKKKKEYSEEEKKQLSELIHDFCFEQDLVYQVYDACENDINLTKNCLQTM